MSSRDAAVGWSDPWIYAAFIIVQLWGLTALAAEPSSADLTKQLDQIWLGRQRLHARDQVPFVLYHLQHASPDVRQSAARALGDLGGVEAIENGVPRLLALLEDDDAAVRRQVTTALGKLGHRARAQVVPALRAQLSDPTTRSAAMQSLGWLGGARARESVSQLQAYLSTPGGSVAALAMARIGGDHARQHLPQIVREYIREYRTPTYNGAQLRRYELAIGKLDGEAELIRQGWKYIHDRGPRPGLQLLIGMGDRPGIRGEQGRDVAERLLHRLQRENVAVMDQLAIAEFARRHKVPLPDDVRARLPGWIASQELNVPARAIRLIPSLERPDPSWAPLLVHHLREGNAATRLAASKALAYTGLAGREPLPDWLALIERGTLDQRLAAAMGLRNTWKDDERDRFVDQLRPRLRDADAQAWALDVIVALGGPRAVAAVPDMIPWISAGHWLDRVDAIEAVRDLTGPHGHLAVEPLWVCLASPESRTPIRVASLEALEAVGWTSLAERQSLLLTLLNQPCDEVRLAALSLVRAAARIPDPLRQRMAEMVAYGEDQPGPESLW